MDRHEMDGRRRTEEVYRVGQTKEGIGGGFTQLYNAQTVTAAADSSPASTTRVVFQPLNKKNTEELLLVLNEEEAGKRPKKWAK
ncbi:hypothetical protein L596_019229 [Steinernema carpocapsae]|uniref:Uncharacterized protein n=1 Tax=Steinernema carpocapsae TaxID=34508 RepID=A0A4U5MPQ8_STECR|nr:hypothetical protein L596_019229 [Steinernema carpocapsae]